MKKDWELKQLNDVCIIEKIKKVTANLPYVGLENIESNSGTFLGTLIPSEVKSSTFSFSDNHILYGRLRPYLNKVLIPNFEGHCSTEIFPIKINSKILKKFLFYWLTSADTVEKINATCTGARMPRANMNEVMKFQLLIPPIEEQKQIVEILDKAFESIEQAKANIEKNIENTKELFQSRLNEIFSQKGDGWEKKTINDVCEKIFAGGDVPKDNFSKEETDKYNIPIFANAVKNKGLYGFTDFAKVTEPSITISARGSGTGHTELREVSFFPIVRLIVLIPNLKLINLEFLKYLIDNLEIVRSGSAIPQLTVPMIKEYSVKFPNIIKQKQIVLELDYLNYQTKQLEKYYKQKLKNLEELKKSILQKAFSGELLK